LVASYWYAEDPGVGRPSGSAYYRYFYLFPIYRQLRLGVNRDISGAAQFLLRVYKMTGDRRYLDVACRQIDWILGCNPMNISTVEGVGRNQPERLINFDEFFPPTPQIPGGVMTGITGTVVDTPSDFEGNSEAEYDMPPTATLMWLMTELEKSGETG
jgi:hypothetical protein